MYAISKNALHGRLPRVAGVLILIILIYEYGHDVHLHNRLSPYMLCLTRISGEFPSFFDKISLAHKKTSWFAVIILT